MNSPYVDIHHTLVEACRRGERKAQAELYRLYAKAMFHAAMRVLNNTAEAEDILQEAFLDAFRKIDSFKGESSFGAWLKRIVVNKAINQLKKRKVQWTELDHERYEPQEDEAIDEEAHQGQMARLHEAIQQLPDGFRTVLSLYLLEDYSHKEIAALLGITESTSKSQLNRAKAKLREMLHQNER